MGNIGGEIVSGALSAVWHLLQAVPITVWLILILGVVAVVFVLRYATNWKVDATIIGVVFVSCEILAIRQHWIDMGRDEMKAQVQASNIRVEAYKKTNGLIGECYARDTTRLDYIWNRMTGTCERVDGATGN